MQGNRRGAVATAALMCGLVAGLSPAGATADTGRGVNHKARAAGPADYAYEREWIYSTDASEIPVAGVGPDGRVYTIAPSSGYGVETSRVRVFDTAGTLITTWDVPLPNSSELDFDAAGNLLITDYAGSIVDDINASVQRWSPQGTLLGTYYLPDYTNTAADVASAPDGTIWVTDATQDLIHRFSAAGAYQGAIGGTGTAAGKLDSPWSLDVLSNGNLVVADRENDRVQVLTPDGAPVAAWGQAGSGNGQFFSGPGAVGVRGDDTVYVSDATSRVQVFSAAGSFLGVVSPTTKRGDVMSKVFSVSFGSDQALYVSGTMYPFENGVSRYLPKGDATPPPPRPRCPGLGRRRSRRSPRRCASVRSGSSHSRLRCSAAGPCAGQLKVSVKGKKLTKPATYSLKAGQSSQGHSQGDEEGTQARPAQGHGEGEGQHSADEYHRQGASVSPQALNNRPGFMLGHRALL